MRIDHIAIYVRDLEGCKAFFENYFDAQANDGYHNPRTGLRTYFLTLCDGADDKSARIEIMTRPDLTDANRGHMDAGFTHLAFSLGSKQAVDELTARLSDAGFEVLSGPRTTGDGYYESSVLGFEGINLELTE